MLPIGLTVKCVKCLKKKNLLLFFKESQGVDILYMMPCLKSSNCVASAVIVHVFVSSVTLYIRDQFSLLTNFLVIYLTPIP